MSESATAAALSAGAKWKIFDKAENAAIPKAIPAPNSAESTPPCNEGQH